MHIFKITLAAANTTVYVEAKNSHAARQIAFKDVTVTKLTGAEARRLPADPPAPGEAAEPFGADFIAASEPASAADTGDA